jgi:hypothetical protein
MWESYTENWLYSWSKRLEPFSVSVFAGEWIDLSLMHALSALACYNHCLIGSYLQWLKERPLAFAPPRPPAPRPTSSSIGGGVVNILCRLVPLFIRLPAFCFVFARPCSRIYVTSPFLGSFFCSSSKYHFFSSMGLFFFLISLKVMGLCWTCLTVHH